VTVRRVVLRVAGVTRTYLTEKGVFDVSFSIGQGERVALVGPNGAGKTTLLEVLAGVAKPKSGTVELMGEPLFHERTYKSRLAYLPEQRGYPAYLSPRLTVRLAEQLWMQPGLQERFCKEAERLGLDRDAMDLPVSALSQGNKEKLALALVFSRRAELYLLDEPEAHLDAISRNRLEKRLHSLSIDAGKALLWATHDVHLAARTADRVAIIHNGRLRMLERVSDGNAILVALEGLEEHRD